MSNCPYLLNNLFYLTTYGSGLLFFFAIVGFITWFEFQDFSSQSSLREHARNINLANTLATQCQSQKQDLNY